jgi:hypothetical protein
MAAAKGGATPGASPAGGPGAVFVDALREERSRTEPARTAGERWGHLWCHLWSDDPEALHRMAEAVGMRREWFQDRIGFPHYDLSPTGRARALELGALERSLKDWLRARRSGGQAFAGNM